MTAQGRTGSAEGPPAAVGGRTGSVEADADAVAAAAAACRTVAGLSGGPTGAVATYLPGRRVVGVRIGERTVTVHVVGVYGPSVAEIGADVRAGLAELAGGREVEVVVEDLVMPAPGTGRAGQEQTSGEHTNQDEPSGEQADTEQYFVTHARTGQGR